MPQPYEAIHSRGGWDSVPRLLAPDSWYAPLERPPRRLFHVSGVIAVAALSSSKSIRLARQGSEADAHGRCGHAMRSPRQLQKETQQRQPRPTQCLSRPRRFCTPRGLPLGKETLARGMGTSVLNQKFAASRFDLLGHCICRSARWKPGCHRRIWSIGMVWDRRCAGR